MDTITESIEYEKATVSDVGWIAFKAKEYYPVTNLMKDDAAVGRVFRKLITYLATGNEDAVQLNTDFEEALYAQVSASIIESIEKINQDRLNGKIGALKRKQKQSEKMQHIPPKEPEQLEQAETKSIFLHDPKTDMYKLPEIHR